MEVLDRIERELARAALRRRIRNRTRRRALLAAGLILGLLVVASVASAVSGDGPLASLLGVRGDDPTLRSTRPTPRGERAVVRAQSASGQRWAFAFFESDGAIVPPGRAGRGFCFAPLVEGRRSLEGVGCGTAESFIRQVARDGLTVEASGVGAGGERSGVLGTAPVYGLVPADVRRVTVQTENQKPLAASVSPSFSLARGSEARGRRVRAFLGVVESIGDVRLTGFTSVTAAATFADGSVRKESLEVAVGFPLAGDQRLKARAPRVRLDSTFGSSRWRMIAYKADRQVLCVSAAPQGKQLISAARAQCSSPFAVINALGRHGVAAYASESDPPGGGARRGSYTVLGHVRAGARNVTVIDQRGRRWEAELSKVWTTARRIPRDLAGIKGPLRKSLQDVPQTAALRAFLVAIPTPPGPSQGDGLRIEVRLADGRTLQQP